MKIPSCWKVILMREIKFDAIYKPTEQHIKPININFNDNTITFNLGTKDNDWCHFSLDGKRGDAILRQYTGLKDKNGTEIYEGDILQYKRLFSTGSESEKEVVHYSEHAEWIVGMWLVNKIWHRAEVIGNIYQNANLLEESK
jgi:uncharacterized phage protein (TIGR01671 family)